MSVAAASLHGLTHIALAVRDLDRSVDFYTRAFGVREYYRDEASAQVLGPGPHDVLAFELDPDRAGQAGDFDNGRPFALVEVPAGYEIELWYEDTPPLEREMAASGA